MKRAVAVVVALAMIAVVAVTVAGYSTTLARAFPELALIRPDTFDSPYTGYGAKLSPDGAAVGVLVENRDVAAFERLAASGDAERQMYGLVGLYALDRARYDRALRSSALDLDQTVRFRDGCVLYDQSISWIVAERLEWRSSVVTDERWALAYTRSATP